MLSERPVTASEVGDSPRHPSDIVLGVIRAEKLHPVDARGHGLPAPGDRLVYVRKTSQDGHPTAERNGRRQPN